MKKKKANNSQQDVKKSSGLRVKTNEKGGLSSSLLENLTMGPIINPNDYFGMHKIGLGG